MSETLPPLTCGQIGPEILRSLVGRDARTVLEIGANDGSHTRMLLQAFPQAALYAFEPDPRAIGKFKANVSSPRVRLFEIAIGTTDEIAEFHASSGLPPEARAYYAQGWDQSGSLRRPKTHKIVWPWCKFENTIAVPVQRLDSWAQHEGVHEVDLIWADLQGAEADLIAGGRQTLAATRFLYTEYSNDEWYEGQPDLQQILALLPGFVIEARYPMDVLLRNTAKTA